MTEENKETSIVEETVEIEEPVLNEDSIQKTEEDEKGEYTQSDLIEEPVGHIEHKEVIGEDSNSKEGILEEASESMKKTDGTKIWVIFNTFISILTLMFAVMIFATQMITPV